MAFFDKLKSAIGFGESAPPAPPPPGPTELERLESSNLDGYISTLRQRWFEKRLAGKEDADYAEQQFFPRIYQRFGKSPDATLYIDLLRGAYLFLDETFYTPERLGAARALTADPQRGLEGWMFLSRGAFQHNAPTRGLSMLQRGLPAHRLLAWEWRLRMRNYVEHLDSRITATEDKAMFERDRSAAATLSCHLVNSALDALTLTADGLPPGIRDKEAEELRGWLAYLVRVAESGCVNSTASPGQFHRIALAAGSAPADPVDRLRSRVIQMRLEKVDDRFRPVEESNHAMHLASLASHFPTVQQEYGAYFPSMELEAETAATNGSPAAAAELYITMHRTMPYRAFFAYRAAQLLEQANRRDEAGRWFIHASRVESSWWRDRIARTNAAMRAHEWEVRALHDLPHERRTPAAAALATALESRFTEAWELLYATAGPPLALRIGQLCHLAGDFAPDAETAESCFEKARDYYYKADRDDLAATLGSRQAPEEVFDPVRLPAGTEAV